MKELSIEEKARRYDEALKYAMIYYKNGNEDMKTMMKTCFPVLVEKSEDERICGKLIAFLKQCKDVYGDGFKQFGLDIDDALAWLEKQGEQKPILDVEIPFGAKDSELEEVSYSIPNGYHAEIEDNKVVIKQGEQKSIKVPKFKIGDFIQFKGMGHTRYTIKEVCGLSHYINICNKRMDMSYTDANFELVEQKPTDKVEPKFKAGDWVVCEAAPKFTAFKTGDVVQISNKETLKLFLMFKDCFRLWDVTKDAKAGDVLSDGKNIILFRNIGNGKWNDVVDYYCGCVKSRGNDVFDMQEDDQYWCCIKECILLPATKEQHDLLFAKMKEAGYEWDAEKKELREIEQKPAKWSKEDERMLDGIIEASTHHCYLNITDIDWLNSLKERVQPNQEWSEEDKTMLCYMEGHLEYLKNDKGYSSNEDQIMLKRQLDWLKSLKERCTWKPSDEQMVTLEYYMHTLVCNSYKETLYSLYHDLKKLREE